MAPLGNRRIASGPDKRMLQKLPFFSSMSEEKVSDVISTATPLRATQGDAIFHQGDTASEFFLLIEGFIRLTRVTAGGQQVVVNHVVPGELFGIAMAVDSEVYSVTSKCATDVRVLAWPKRDWQTFSEDLPSFSATNRRTLGKRMAEIRSRVVEMATQPAKQRIASELLRLIEIAGRETEAGQEIGLPLTRQDLADVTGVNMHSISRTMSAWEKDGVVGKTGKIIVVRKLSEVQRQSRELGI